MAQRKNSGRTQPRAGFREHRNNSATKKGPGRYHQGGAPGRKLARQRRTRAADALTAAWAQKRVVNWKGARDEHGAYTCVGSVYDVYAAEGEVVHPNSREHVFGGARWKSGHANYTAQRKWLAGISAQRGY